jgi:ribosomal-protein-alanine N-acetyltransferase
MNSSSVVVRRMALADLDRVVEIAQSLHDAPHWQRSAYVEALDPEAGLPRIALVAMDCGSGIVVGFVVASVVPPQAELESIAVDPAFQRRGVAARLFAALLKEISPAQVTEVILEVRASNFPPLTLYAALGFREIGRRPRYYADPIEDAVLMSLRLG